MARTRNAIPYILSLGSTQGKQAVIDHFRQHPEDVSLARHYLQHLAYLQGLALHSEAIFREEAPRADVRSEHCYARVPEGIKSVGVKGDQRAYGPVVVLHTTRQGEKHVVTDNDLFSKVYTHPNLLEIVSTRITNEVPDITRVCILLPSGRRRTIRTNNYL